MEKKWWYLVFVFLMLAVAVFVAAVFLNEEPVQTLQGGVVIMSPGQQFPTNPSTGGETGEFGSEAGGIEESQIAGEGIIYPEGVICLECPLGGTILNVRFGDLTDELVQNMTNCTNVTQLMPIDCPTNVTNQTCGNGVCESYETVESCPADCAALSPTTEEKSSEEDVEEEIVEREIEESSGEEELFGGEYHSVCTTKTSSQPSQCVFIKGPGENQCTADNDCIGFTGHIPGMSQRPQFNPVTDSLLEKFIKLMFGLP
jgi:hypothetical protein